mmetsp:Transcript_59639/g.99059  ORF Transcript_59639/g.99059 Transcript_59639/m.99059 type:complete len:165 (-) Transcript_59639:29-523(-)
MPEGLGLDENFLSKQWVKAHAAPDHAAHSSVAALAGEKFDGAAVGRVLQELVRAAQEIIEKNSRFNAFCKGGGKELSLVVTSDGNMEAAGCDFLELASAFRRDFGKSSVASSWPRLRLADVHPEKAVIMGALATASTPEGRKQFRSAEGSCPPPSFQRPSLHRW